MSLFTKLISKFKKPKLNIKRIIYSPGTPGKISIPITQELIYKTHIQQKDDEIRNLKNSSENFERLFRELQNRIQEISNDMVVNFSPVSFDEDDQASINEDFNSVDFDYEKFYNDTMSTLNELLQDEWLRE